MFSFEFCVQRDHAKVFADGQPLQTADGDTKTERMENGESRMAKRQTLNARVWKADGGRFGPVYASADFRMRSAESMRIVGFES